VLKKRRGACERRLSVFILRRWRDVGAALSNSAQVYVATTPISSLPIPFSFALARIGSSICHISNGGEVNEQDKRAFKL